jgi:hypothetical protein
VHEEIEPGRYTACFQGEILLEIKQWNKSQHLYFYGFAFVKSIVS